MTPEQERVQQIEKRAGLRAGKRYSTDASDFQQAVDDVRFLLGLHRRNQGET